MKHGLKRYLVVVLMVGQMFSLFVRAEEDWKGKPDEKEVSFGGLTGMGIVNSAVGYAVLGTISKKIVRHGFAPDINDSVSIEAEVGPVFMSVGTALAYSTHLRWDFNKDPNWTFYGLGGVGGHVISLGLLNRFQLNPRFGIGAFWKITALIHVRAELSHDLVALGINLPF